MNAVPKLPKFKLLFIGKISKLPESSGVYFFIRGEKILYIGKAVNLRERVKQHHRFLKLATKVGFIKTRSEVNALLLEANLIKKYRPEYNIAWRDDKNYFYVGITRETFPKVFITHQPKIKEKCSRYIGPFVDGKELKQTLKNLRKTYPYRTCKTLPKHPCLWYHLGQCPAPCLLKSRRIEAYDISNIQGKDATGAMVTFINGEPDKNLYRRFKIKTIDRPNDIGMIKEVLSRRFKHPEWGFPDLILIDGGKSQLNAAISAAKIPVIAIAKMKNELYMKNLEKPVLLKNLPRETFNLILRLRDEAHRFAISYHHILRKRGLIGS